MKVDIPLKKESKPKMFVNFVSFLFLFTSLKLKTTILNYILSICLLNFFMKSISIAINDIDCMCQEKREKKCCVLTFDPAQKCYSKVMHRKEVTHSNAQ